MTDTKQDTTVMSGSDIDKMLNEMLQEEQAKMDAKMRKTDDDFKKAIGEAERKLTDGHKIPATVAAEPTHDGEQETVVPAFLERQAAAASASSQKANAPANVTVEEKPVRTEVAPSDTGASDIIPEDGNIPVEAMTGTIQYDLVNNEPMSEETHKALEAIIPEDADADGRTLNMNNLIDDRLSVAETIYNWFDNSKIAHVVCSVLTMLLCLMILVLAFRLAPDAMGTVMSGTTFGVLFAAFAGGMASYAITRYVNANIRYTAADNDLASRLRRYRKSLGMMIALTVIAILMLIAYVVLSAQGIVA